MRVFVVNLEEKKIIRLFDNAYLFNLIVIKCINIMKNHLLMYMYNNIN